MSAMRASVGRAENTGDRFRTNAGNRLVSVRIQNAPLFTRPFSHRRGDSVPRCTKDETASEERIFEVSRF